MASQADFVIYDRNDQPVLMVEAIKRKSASPDWATLFRRNLLVHGNVTPSKYFMLALLDHFYIWQDSSILTAEQSPNFVVDAEPLLRPYFDRVEIKPEDITGTGFQMVVALWLNDLIHPFSKNKSLNTESLIQFRQLGLYDLLEGGRMVTEAVA